MTQRGAGAVLAGILLTFVPSGNVMTPTACASPSPRAALVVDTGAAVTRYCVTLDSQSVSGLHLIELASAQHGLSYRFGFGGKAVCMLEDVGPSGEDCFEDYPHFWGYWRGDGSGGWTWSGSGAGSTAVGDGDVEGWSWGTGQDGSTHPAPPATAFDEVCETAPGPAPSAESDRSSTRPGAQRTHGRDRAAHEPAAAPRAYGGVRSPRESGEDRRIGDGGKRAASRSSVAPARGGRALDGESPAAAAPASSRRGDDGPPAAGLAALAAVAVLAAWGARLQRRRGLRKP